VTCGLAGLRSWSANQFMSNLTSGPPILFLLSGSFFVIAENPESVAERFLRVPHPNNEDLCRPSGIRFYPKNLDKQLVFDYKYSKFTGINLSFLFFVIPMIVKNST
jgi:hypothetical protein